MIAAHQTMLAPQETWPVPLYTGVNLVGSSVQNNNGVLSGFTSSSYATMPYYMTSGATSLEAVIMVNITSMSANGQGIWGCVGSSDSFTPFFIGTVGGSKGLVSYISSNGSSWDIEGGYPVWATVKTNTNILLRCRFTGADYVAEKWENSAWATKKNTANSNPPYGTPSLVPQLGTNRGSNQPITGTIDLNYTYLYRDGELWWEGAAGAYRNVKTTYPD